MSTTRALRRPARPARLARLLAALLFAWSALLPAAAGPVLAADITFGEPAAEVAYGEGITFTVPMAASVALSRVEIRLEYPGGIGPFVEQVPAQTGADGTLTYRLDVAGGGYIVPNTTIAATWAAVPEGGGEPVLSATETVRYADTDQDWRTLRGDLVVVHWYEGSEAFARKALEIGDQAVKDTADLLGVTETEPVDFFIYGDQPAFLKALGPATREYIAGQAHADIRTLFGLITPNEIDSSWVGVLVPHELTHLVFDTAVNNPYRFAPHWVNEGLAVYLSEGYGPADRNLVAQAVDDRELLPLSAITVRFPTGQDQTYLAYAEAVSAIDHLVGTYGEPALYGLIDAYAEGLTDDEAFTRATGTDVAGFEAGWLQGLRAEDPEAYGPKPYPPGPLPQGWGEPGAPAEPSAAPPAEPPAAPGGDQETAGDGSGRVLVVGAVALVVVVVIGGMVIARRRTAPS